MWDTTYLQSRRYTTKQHNTPHGDRYHGRPVSVLSRKQNQHKPKHEEAEMTKIQQQWATRPTNGCQSWLTTIQRECRIWKRLGNRQSKHARSSNTP